jgi:hypothetical protein
MTARGFRDNNPGNIRPNPAFHWLGQDGSEGGYLIFDTPENGLRAISLQLLIYHDKHGVNTIADAITRWAPPEDNNDTAAYIAAVAQHCGVAPDAPYDFTDPVALALITEAIVQHENGSQPYTDTQLAVAVNAATAAV